VLGESDCSFKFLVLLLINHNVETIIHKYTLLALSRYNIIFPRSLVFALFILLLFGGGCFEIPSIRLPFLLLLVRGSRINVELTVTASSG
jgi:hypothetical protein